MENDFTTIFVHFGNEAKKLFLAKSMSSMSFLSAIRGMFAKGFDVIKYRDEEGEMVTMGSAEEYEEAITKVAPALGNELHVFLIKKGEEPTAGGKAMLHKDSQRDCPINGDNRDLPLNPGIKQPPSLNIENGSVQHSPNIVSSDMLQKNKEKAKRGYNPVKYYSELTRSFFEEERKKEAEKKATEDQKENRRTAPHDEVLDDKQKNGKGPKRGYNSVKYFSDLTSSFFEEEKKKKLMEVQREDDRMPPPAEHLECEMEFSERAVREKLAHMSLMENDLKQKKKCKKRRRRRRKSISESSSSSSSSSDSDTEGHPPILISDFDASICTEGSSSSSSSSSSDTSSESSSESESSVDEHEIAKSNPKDDTRKRQKRKDKSRDDIRLMARKVSHYISPDLCDEVEHCMHHFERHIRKSLLRKITECITSVVKEHTYTAANDSSNAAAAEKAGLKKVSYYHKDITCDGCDQSIFGPRYKCGNCEDYDLCSACEAIEGLHDETHVFIKIVKPARNAGRKGGKGRMRPLLKENIYTFQESEKSGSVKPENKEIEKALKLVLPIKAELPAKPVKKVDEKLKPGEHTKPKPGEDRVVENAANTKKEVDEEVADAKKEVDEEVADAKKEVVVEASAAKEEVIKEPPVTKEEVIEKVEPINEDLKILPHTKKDVDGYQLEDVPESSPDSNHEMSKTDIFNSEKAADDHETEDDDVIIVRRGHSIEKVSNTTPDLVDIDGESISSNSSEDFIVVPKVFDYNSPLDESVLLQHKLSCNGEHDGPCFVNTRDPDAAPHIEMDLVASTIKKPRSPPNGEPDVTNSDVSAVHVVEKQPDFNPLAAADAVTVQPKLSNPLRPNLSPAVTKEQPKRDKVNEQPLAIVISSELSEVKQPPVAVMYGRGAAPKAGEKTVTEPGLLIIRDSGMRTPKAVDVTSTNQMKTAKAEQTRTQSTPKFQPELDLSPDEIQRDGPQRIKKAPTWSPELSDEVLSTKDLLSETLHGIVGATASAATAVYEGVSNAFNSVDKLPNVKYQNDHVIISHKDGSVEGIPRPLQTPERTEKALTPSMSANDTMFDMGFCDRTQNEKLLKKHKGNISQCVAELLSDNDWHAQRH